MDKLWAIVQRYVEANAQHVTKGYRLADVTEGFVLERARDELDELVKEPNDIYEMVDTLGCLLHYCQRKGWSPEALANALEEKLKLRFHIWANSKRRI